MESTDADSGVPDLLKVTAVFQRVRETVNSIFEPLRRVHDFSGGVIWYGLREQRASGETVPSEDDKNRAWQLKRRTHTLFRDWTLQLLGLQSSLDSFVLNAVNDNFTPADSFFLIRVAILKFRMIDVNTLMQGLDDLEHFVNDFHVSRINVANRSRAERQPTFDVVTLRNDFDSLRRLLPDLAGALDLARSQYDTHGGPSPAYDPGRQPDGHNGGAVSARAYARPALAVVVPRSLGVSYHLRRVRVLGGSLQARFR